MIRDKDGRLVRENPKITEQLDNELTMYKRGLMLAQRTGSLKEDDRWIAVREALEKKLKQLDYELDEFEKHDQRANDLRLQRKADFRFFISIVEDVEDHIHKMEQMIAITENKINERRKEPASI